MDKKPAFVLDSYIAKEHEFEGQITLDFCDFITIDDEQVRSYIAEGSSPEDVFSYDVLIAWAREHKSQLEPDHDEKRKRQQLSFNFDEN